MMGGKTLETLQVSDSDERKVRTFLFQEARLLDSDRYDAWMGLLDPAFTYQLSCPSVETWKRMSDDPPPAVLLLDETMGSLTSRVKQLTTASFTVF